MYKKTKLSILKEECKIEVKVINLKDKNNKEYYNIMIKLNNHSIEPSPRPRNSIKVKGFYDPLASYKNYLKKQIKEKLPKDFKICEGPIEIEINYKKNPPKSWSIQKIIYTFKSNNLNYHSKPDNDNIEKTVYDTLNEIIWKDDKQIWKNCTSKTYSINNETIININAYKDEFNEYKDLKIDRNWKKTSPKYLVDFIEKLKKKGE